ncbi:MULTISPECIES: ATPase [unclassified Halorhabdus]|uniref:ATPase n=1 Tax=unclassified Halorhabdus TaxID=2621901 RepID=UPI0023DBA78A|nr:MULTISPECIES: ATPase [unclassified Halorhabdus]WEL17863.1 Putative P-loop ATPase/GTPase [Halorhabdus sp. SVX81]WEL21739.1 Putative P-loop ATPase/GTPase [Halorhabdus sp. BNX81]
MNLLVAGADRVDAGKTTFSTGLLEHTGAVGFKPRAGNDYWFDHDDYHRAVGDGRLYGKDARRLATASPGERSAESLNPIHRLWRPEPSGGSGLLGQSDREFLVDRIGDRYVVNGTVELPESARENLPLSAAVAVDSLQEFNGVMQRHHLPALESIRETIESADRAVVESYGNIARPLSDLRPDAVAVVEPRRARIYPGSRYEKACRVASGSAKEGQLEERVSAVTDLTDPVASVTLPALGADQRQDPVVVAEAYEHAYDALLATAFE